MVPTLKIKIFLFFLFSFRIVTAQQWNGLTLYSNMNSTLGYLIDTNNTVVKSYTFTGGTGYSTHMMPGGDIYRSVKLMSTPLNGGGVTGRMQKLNYNGTLLWDYTYSSSTYVLHHDHCPLPNGNVLVICYEVKTATEASQAGALTPTLVWSEKIEEWEPIGSDSVNVVWSWHLWDHLVQNVDTAKLNYKASIVDHPELMNINYNFKKDWVHMNGIDYNPVLDQIVVSSHNLNEWWVIDHSTTIAEAASHSGGKSGKGGDFLYRWGNPAAYSAGGSAILNVTHDAHWVPEGCTNAGYFAGINNKGVSSPSNKTTADQVQSPRNGFTYTINPGSAYSPSSYSSRHQSTGYTSNMGSVEEYPNGNQMICLATAGLIYEIDANGTMIWSKSTSGSTPQAHRYSQCYIDHAAPPQPSITVNQGTLNSSSATSYQWYLNGNAVNGATNQAYVPVLTGTYVVAVTDQNNCTKAYSALLSHTVQGGGEPTGLPSLFNPGENFGIYPNPGSGSFVLNGMDEQEVDFLIKVYSLEGKIVYSGKNIKLINLEDQNEGLYIVTVFFKNGSSSTRKISLIR